MATPDSVIDSVCGMRIDPSTAAATRQYRGTAYYFCSVRCAEKFDADADAYIAASQLPEMREDVPDRDYQ